MRVEHSGRIVGVKVEARRRPVGGGDEPFGASDRLGDEAGVGIELERLALRDELSPRGGACPIEQRGLGETFEDHHLRFAVGLDVERKLGPQVDDGRSGGSDDEPFGPLGDAGPEPAPAAENPVDRDEVDVRRAFQREHHAAEERERGTARAEAKPAGRQDRSLLQRSALLQFPAGGFEGDHEGQSTAGADLGSRDERSRSFAAPLGPREGGQDGEEEKTGRQPHPEPGSPGPVDPGMPRTRFISSSSSSRSAGRSAALHPSSSCSRSQRGSVDWTTLIMPSM